MKDIELRESLYNTLNTIIIDILERYIIDQKSVISIYNYM